jgi:hypothetical protein
LNGKEVAQFCNSGWLSIPLTFTSVAIGDREVYKSWYQGPMVRFTYGKQYKRVDPDDIVEPQVSKQGVRGFFLGGLKQRTDDDN